MDRAALTERRAALKRRHRRRRRVLGAAAIAVVAGLVAVTVGGHADHGRPPAPTRATTHRPAATTQPAGATQAAGALRAALPGAHHATHEAVPILMYHVIGDIRPGTPNPTLWVSPRDFEAHVRALRRAGYHGVTLQQVYNAWHRHALLPSRPVVLSFDDGYLGQVRFALPVLARAGWPGVLNLKLGNINDMGGTRAIRRMIRAGWEVDSHTISHPDLTTLDGPRLHYELAGSRARLRRYFRVAVNFICYPSGRFDDTVVAAARSAGYRAATTTQPGWARPADDRFTLPRVRVDGGMTAHAVLQRMRDARAP